MLRQMGRNVLHLRKIKAFHIHFFHILVSKLSWRDLNASHHSCQFAFMTVMHGAIFSRRSDGKQMPRRYFRLDAFVPQERLAGMNCTNRFLTLRLTSLSVSQSAAHQHYSQKCLVDRLNCSKPDREGLKQQLIDSHLSMPSFWCGPPRSQLCRTRTWTSW